MLQISIEIWTCNIVKLLQRLKSKFLIEMVKVFEICEEIGGT